ncbi:hypothetical protein SK128_013942 [Halocaridina rubra]|uniref:Uncharacterized protein n=1 Tax=Halocaridina rubra TaxID=373956 RepID=A0AAN8X7G6_HALRR
MEKANLFEEPQVIKSWKGFDGALNIEPLSQGFIKYLDLSKEQDLGERFDWVMSVEVGEHIPHEYETVFLENLVRHACKGLVLTWSSEIGKGHFHVNIHPREYIIDRVVKMGLKHDPVAQETLTETISLDYIKKGLMVFRVDPMKC